MSAPARVLHHAAWDHAGPAELQVLQRHPPAKRALIQTLIYGGGCEGSPSKPPPLGVFGFFFSFSSFFVPVNLGALGLLRR